MSSNLKMIIFLLIILILINFIGISILVYTQNNRIENSPYTAYNNYKKNDIQIKFKILDIYRIDMSCDYIVNALSGKINIFKYYINKFIYHYHIKAR
jgi:hypothetical protein